MRTATAAGHRWLATILLALGLLAATPTFAAIGTAFTYQGRLAQSGTTVSGTVDLQFEVYDQATGGASVGGPVSLANVVVTDGLFTVQLDFGATTFNGDRRWLEIRVSSDFPTVPYTTLAPRQDPHLDLAQPLRLGIPRAKNQRCSPRGGKVLCISTSR